MWIELGIAIGFSMFMLTFHVLCVFVAVLIDVGASDAADWAIARSLSALRAAEQKGDLKDKKPHTEESHEEDDESV